jgi:hypothetical protein
VWKVTLGGLETVFDFPDTTGVGGVSTYAYPIRSMAAEDARLHVPILDVGGLGLYSYDGQGWAHLATGGSGEAPRGIAVFNGDCYLTNQHSSGAAIHQVERKSPASAVWISSFFDADLPVTDKLWTSLTVRHAALAANQAIAIDYELDGSGSWVNLGTSNTLAATSKTFSFASGITSKKLRIRFTMTVVDRTATPKLQAILTTYVVAPDVKAEWELTVRLEGTAQAPLRLLDNSNEASTGAQLSSALWASRVKKQTLSFTDLDASVKSVYFTELDEKVAESQRLGPHTQAQLTLQEA